MSSPDDAGPPDRHEHEQRGQAEAGDDAGALATSADDRSPIAVAAAVPPLITAPLSVERAPKASAGPAAVAVVVDDILRKTGLGPGRRLLRATNQAEGFACSGCAWPRGDEPRRLRVCESGARITIAAAERRVAGERLFATYNIPELAARSDHWLTAQGRLTQPMVRRPGSDSYAPIAWPDALTLLARSLDALPSPARAWIHTTGQLSCEARFALELFARELGTPNLTSSAQLCHDASRLAMQSVLGGWRSPVRMADFAAAQTIFVFGQNPGSNHRRMLERLRDARERGATIVGVNPIREVGLRRLRDPRRPRDWLGPGAEIANRHVDVRIGGDLALLEGLCKATLARDDWDRTFVDDHAEGLAALEAGLAARPWAELEAQSGVAREEIEALAALATPDRPTLACWGLGLTQHRHGVATVEQLLTWLLLNGHVGRPGAGPLAVLGHTNTAGGWAVSLGRDPSPAQRERFTAATGLPVPATPGLDLPAALAAMAAGELDVLVGVGGNLLSSAPGTEAVAAGLRRLSLSVHVATRLNRSHLITGETALLLPARAGHERGLGSSEAPDARDWSSHEDACAGLVASRGVSPGPAEARGELDILAAIATELWPDSDRDWPALARDPGRVRELIAAAVPAYAALTSELGPARAIQLEVPARARSFATPSGRAELRHHLAPPTPAGLLLTTIRSHDQHNSQIFGLGDRERGILGYRRVVLMNLDDIRERELEPYDQVDIVAKREGREAVCRRWVVIPHHVRPGCAAAYWPEINELLGGDELDPRSRTPSLKATVVSVRASA